MNRDDIILWAAEADFYADALLGGRHHIDFHKARDAHFANLVAAAEREACARACESLYGKSGDGNTSLVLGSLVCAAAIRARGQE